jgi:phytoene dehydrogenase-like protein
MIARSGMSSLIDAIVDDVTAMGVTIVTNTPVSNIAVHAAEPSFYDRIDPVTGVSLSLSLSL